MSGPLLDVASDSAERFADLASRLSWIESALWCAEAEEARKPGSRHVLAVVSLAQHLAHEAGSLAESFGLEFLRRRNEVAAELNIPAWEPSAIGLPDPPVFDAPEVQP